MHTNTLLRATLAAALFALLSHPAQAQRTVGKAGKSTADTTAPVLSLPASLRAEATSRDGAVVGFSASATDDVDRKVTVTCTPSSGAVFPLGSTTVACESRDSAGNRSTGSFAVGVVDTVAPAILVPGTLDAAATDPTGSEVVYAVSASDRVDVAASVQCSPASGSVFPPGTTSVRCGAADFSGNRSAGSFDVTVSYTAPAPVATGPVVTTGSATLTWSTPTTRADGQPLAMSELAGYEVYMLAESTGISQVIPVTDPLSTGQTIDGLTPDTYHFAISAIDTSGLVSQMSTTVSKQVP